MGVVYQATNINNGMKYIGKTIKSLKSRIGGHLHDSIKSNRPFSTAIRVCGSNNFKWNILLESDDNELLKWYEKYCIKLYNTKTPYGYNVANGKEGHIGPIMSNQEEEFRCRVVYAEQNIEVYMNFE